MTTNVSILRYHAHNSRSERTDKHAKQTGTFEANNKIPYKWERKKQTNNPEYPPPTRSHQLIAVEARSVHSGRRRARKCHRRFEPDSTRVCEKCDSERGQSQAGGGDFVVVVEANYSFSGSGSQLRAVRWSLLPCDLGIFFLVRHWNTQHNLLTVDRGIVGGVFMR